MELSDLYTFINTILLVIIFFYQKNKNKVLLDRIDQQEKIINETKGIVTQQSTAIDSQSKVVDTAIKYSESFSPDKFEAVIRRELEHEQKEEIRKIQKEFENKTISKEEADKRMKRLANLIADVADGLAKDVVQPLSILVVKLLFYFPQAEREKFHSDMEDTGAKSIVRAALDKIASEENKSNDRLEL